MFQFCPLPKNYTAVTWVSIRLLSTAKKRITWPLYDVLEHNKTGAECSLNSLAIYVAKEKWGKLIWSFREVFLLYNKFTNLLTKTKCNKFSDELLVCNIAYVLYFSLCFCQIGPKISFYTRWPIVCDPLHFAERQYLKFWKRI